MPWREQQVIQRVYVIDPAAPREWQCTACGFANKPRAVTNSLNTIPAGHPLFDPAWRASHCEQCGAERSD